MNIIDFVIQNSKIHHEATVGELGFKFLVRSVPWSVRMKVNGPAKYALFVDTGSVALTSPSHFYNGLDEAKEALTAASRDQNTALEFLVSVVVEAAERAWDLVSHS